MLLNMARNIYIETAATGLAEEYPYINTDLLRRAASIGHANQLSLSEFLSEFRKRLYLDGIGPQSFDANGNFIEVVEGIL